MRVGIVCQCVIIVNGNGAAWGTGDGGGTFVGPGVDCFGPRPHPRGIGRSPITTCCSANDAGSQSLSAWPQVCGRGPRGGAWVGGLDVRRLRPA
jgi:hypothetical protein